MSSRRECIINRRSRRTTHTCCRFRLMCADLCRLYLCGRLAGPAGPVEYSTGWPLAGASSASPSPASIVVLPRRDCRRLARYRTSLPDALRGPPAGAASVGNVWPPSLRFRRVSGFPPSVHLPTRAGPWPFWVRFATPLSPSLLHCAECSLSTATFYLVCGWGRCAALSSRASPPIRVIPFPGTGCSFLPTHSAGLFYVPVATDLPPSRTSRGHWARKNYTKTSPSLLTVCPPGLELMTPFMPPSPDSILLRAGIPSSGPRRGKGRPGKRDSRLIK